MKKYLLPLLLLCVSIFPLSAQHYPGIWVNAGPDQVLPCGANCTTLSSTHLPSFTNAAGTGYSQGPINYTPYNYFGGTLPPASFFANDDTYSSSATSLPFYFCFFGNAYNQLVLGNNDVITFNLSNIGGSNAWPLQSQGTIPSSSGSFATDLNSIMGPYMDIYPPALAAANANYINFGIYGSYPNRRFVISYYKVPYFIGGTCPDSITCQTVLYETTNVIEIYIGSKHICTGWNGGLAVEGIQNATGTIAYVVPGRNNTQWSVDSDAYRFVPSGNINLVYTRWYQGDSVFVGAGDTINVCPQNNVATMYVARAYYIDCHDTAVVKDTMYVRVLQSAGPTQYISCPSPTATAHMAATGSGSWTAIPTNPSFPTITNPISPTTTIVGFTVPGTYLFQWSSGLCVDTARVIVTANANAGPDQNRCKFDTVTMAAYGTGVWSALSTNPSTTVITAPTLNTTTITGFSAGGAYSFVWTTAAGCSDTMVVNIPFFDLAMTAGSTTVCQFSNTTVTVSPTVSNLGPFSITWLDSTIVQTPHSSTTVVNSLPGSTWYHVQVTSNDGCKLTDSILISTTTSIGTTIKASAFPTLICPGDLTTLTVVGNPNSCGLATGGCSATNTLVTAGTATTYQTGTAYQYPSPYGNYYKSAHHQFLIHASELLGQVPSGGQIKSLALDIHTNNSSSALSNFTIKMACVPDDSLDGRFIGLSSLTTVYTAASYLPVTGWNTHNFPVPYDWDGVSNIVVDICFLNTTNNNINPKMVFTTTPFQSVWCTYANDPNGQCSVVGYQASPNVPYAQLFQRPNMRFNMCITSLTGANLVWTPSTGPNAPVPDNLDTVFAHPVSSTQYQVALTSANGCVNYDYVTVNIDTSVKLHLNNDTFICSPQPIQLNAQVTGTNVIPANVSYTWTASSGPVPPSGTGVAYSTYTVTPTSNVTYTVHINAGTGCQLTDTMHVTMGTSLPVNKIVDSITCAGTSTGKVIINMNQGIAPYTYVWTPAAGGNDSITNLGPGTYSVVVTDNAGCIGHDTTRLVSPAPLTLTFDSTNVLCFGASTGTTLAHVGGGRTPYQYSWSPAAANSPSLSGLAAGTYHLTATDASGCTIAGTVNITQPAQLTSSASSTNLSGAGTHNGTITLTTSGGTPGYTYSSVPAVTGLPNATGLDTGTYIITVCDANHCCVNDTAHITGPPPIFIYFATVNNLCYGFCNGSASVTAAGGVPPYTYHWSNAAGSTTDTITNLCAGVYTVTVTDAHGLTVSNDTTITAPTQIAQHIDSTSISCFGAADGILSDSAYHGTGPYTYVWTPPVVNRNPYTNLGPGTYIVQVTDGNGCIVKDTVSLGQPAALVDSIISTDSVSCFGGSNGYANVAVTGGTRPYSYVWGGSASVDSFANDLQAGAHTVSVTDAHGCSTSVRFTIDQPAPLVSSATTTPLSGAGTHDGTITVTTSGGTAAYTYSSNPSVTGLPNATGLDTGIYYIFVTDARGCLVRDTAHITGPPPIVITFTVTNDRCHDSCNGTATAAVSGGVPPYTYVWNTVPATTSLGTGLSITGLCPGSYQISVTDSNHITATKDTVITAPPALGMQIDSTPITCHGAANGTLYDSVWGGTPTYIITWSSGTGNPLTNLGPGRYIVNVTDANGCRAADTAYLGQPPLVTAVITAKDSVSCFGLSDGFANVHAGGGRPPFSYAWSGSASVDSSANDLAAGSQTVTVTDATGCTALVTFTIFGPAQLLITGITTDPAHCATSHDGSATAHVSGGTPGYNFAWDGTSNGPIDSITRISSGYHTFLVVDYRGCIDTSSFYVDTVYVLHLAMTTDSVTCNGGSDGKAFTTVLNGYAPYTYSWTTSISSTDSVTGVPAGPQIVFVEDFYQCIAIDTVIVGQPTPISDAPYFSNPLCAGQQSGKVWITAGSTVGPYTFTFNGGSTVHPITDTIYNLGAGTYTFTITDGKGCTKSDNVTLTDPPALQILAPTITGISCANDANGIIQINATGGTPAYTYIWAPGGFTGAVQDSLSAGTYLITVTDANGCVQSTSVILTSPPRISLLYAGVDSVSCPDSANGHIVVDPTGGTPFNTNVPYTYSLDGIHYVTNHNFYDLAAGAYTIYVMDSPGCVFDTVLNVYQPFPVTVAINPQDSLIPLGASIQLLSTINNNSSQSINSYSWTPADGLNCIDCANPVATPFVTTDYYLTLNYGKNCTTYASNRIEVGPGAGVYIPNAFTPNGDGVNDVFEVFGESLQSVGMTVFDRWGEKVFDSGTSQWAAWDGTYRGVMQPPGVFTYFVQLVYLDGSRATREGSITLIR